jgi:hypothetical protein
MVYISIFPDMEIEMSLSPRQEAFCRFYVAEPNGAAAARKAGYAEGNAASQAARLLTRPEVAARITELGGEGLKDAAALADEREAAARELSDKLIPVYKANLRDGDYDGVLQTVELQARVRRLVTGGSTIRARGPRPAAPMVEKDPTGPDIKQLEARLDDHLDRLETVQRVLERIEPLLDPTRERDLLRKYDRRGRYDPYWYRRPHGLVDSEGYLDIESAADEFDAMEAAKANESQ